VFSRQKAKNPDKIQTNSTRARRRDIFESAKKRSKQTSREMMMMMIIITLNTCIRAAAICLSSRVASHFSLFVHVRSHVTTTTTTSNEGSVFYYADGSVLSVTKIK
jgi:hypothetical protein